MTIIHHRAETRSRGGRSFWRCARGAAAVEFALIVPILAAMLLGVVDVSRIVSGRADMHASLRNGAQYFMAGGADIDSARLIVENSWASVDEGSGVDVVTYCECGGAAAVCGRLCHDDSVPDIFHQLESTITISGVFGHYEVTARESVRAR